MFIEGVNRTPRQIRKAGERFDREIDAYKAQQRRAEQADRKARAKELRENRIKAKALLPAMFEHERFAGLVHKCDVTPARMRSELKSRAHWNPTVIFKLAAEWGMQA